LTNFEMKLTQKQAQGYKKASKKKKGQILDEYCKLTGANRETACKRFQRAGRKAKPRVLKVRSKKRGRKKIYGKLHAGLVEKLWELSDEICGERLYPMVGEYLNQLAQNDELRAYPKKVVKEVEKISEASLKRIIAEFPKARTKKHQGNANIYKKIPIDAHFGKKADLPGYVEIDYVEHNGGSSRGVFACTGTYVDICFGWVARAAGLGKSRPEVVKIHQLNETRIHHRVKEFHPDNAKPILSYLLERVTTGKGMKFEVSRSRPYHKEDNGHVEQKNDDKVRKLVGYHRYDTKSQVNLLNQLYEVEDLI